MADLALKICTGPCARKLPLDRFHKHRGKKSNKDGLRPQCIDCERTRRTEYRNNGGRATMRESSKKWRHSHRERYNASQRIRSARFRAKWGKQGDHLKTRYGLTVEEFDRMVASQNGLCAICQKPPEGDRLFVDHNHATEKIRQLLCNKCNSGLGMFCDDRFLLTKAIEYLTKHQ